MKKTQFIELIHTVKGTIVSFISITMFVALSVGVFVGISWSAKAILESTSIALESKNARDIEILFPYGLDDEDIEFLSKQEHVDEIEGSYTGYSFFKLNEATYQAKLYQINDSIDLPLSIEGTKPKEINEIGIDKLFASINKIEIGDTIKFISDVNNDEARALVKILNFDLDNDNLAELESKSDNPMGYLKTDTFVVTALMTNNDYLNTNSNTYGVAPTNQIAVDCFIYLPKSAFDETSFAGYPEIAIRNNELREYSTFSTEYKQKAKEFEEQLRESINLLTNNKNKAIKEKINSIIDDTQAKLDNANSQIKNGEKQIAEGKKQLTNGKKQLEDIKAELEEGEIKYNNSKAQLNNYYGIFNDCYAKYTSIKELIESETINEDFIVENKEEIESTAYTILIFVEEYNSENQLDEVVNILQEIIDNLDNEELILEKIYSLQPYFDPIDNFFLEVKNKLNGLNSELGNARTTLDDYWYQYNSGIEEYNKRKAQINAAEKKLVKAKAEYEEGVNKLDSFINQTLEIKDCGYSVLTRSFNIGLITSQTLSDVFNKLRFTLAALFVCVGFLVCYSTISRIVYDEIINIGTKKALGLSEKEIMRSYLTYTSLSIIIGCILGASLGYIFVENILIRTINRNIVCKLNLYFSYKDVVIICLIEVTILLLITYLACKTVLKRNTVKLLGGQANATGKQRVYEKTIIWKKLSLISKTIINNCFDEKRRVFSTIVGIAGATSLIVTALTLNNNILDSFEIQYSKYHHFDKIISFDDSDNKSKEEIEKVFVDNNVPYARIMFSRMYVETQDNDFITSILFVPENDDEFNKMMTIEATHNNQNNVNQGLWITNSYEEFYKPSNDDEISLRSLSGAKAEIAPSGYFVNYLTNYHVVMDKETYEENFNEEVKYNSYIVSTSNTDIYSLNEKIKDIPGYMGYQDYYITTRGSFDAFKTLSEALVIVYVVLSIAMAFLVLLNLLVMFVNEKKRELIVLMINGYYLKDVKKYIYYDTIFLTILGIVFGCLFGSIMGNVSVSSFESNVLHFLHRVNYESCLIGAVVSTILTFVICLIALRKISKFKLTDINMNN